MLSHLSDEMMVLGMIHVLMLSYIVIRMWQIEHSDQD